MLQVLPGMYQKIQSFPTITLNQRFPASTTKASGFSRKLLKMREVYRIYSNIQVKISPSPSTFEVDYWMNISHVCILVQEGFSVMYIYNNLKLSLSHYFLDHNIKMVKTLLPRIGNVKYIRSTQPTTVKSVIIRKFPEGWGHSAGSSKAENRSDETPWNKLHANCSTTHQKTSTLMWWRSRNDLR